MSRTSHWVPAFGPQVRAALIGLAAFSILAALSLMFAREAGRVAAIWPANGALLALVLLRPRTERGGLIAGAFVGNVGVALAMGDTTFVAIGLSLANAVEVAIAAWLMRGQDAREMLLKGRSLLRFVVASGIVAPLVSTSLAAVTLAIGQHQSLFANGMRWLVADALGMLIIAPPILLMAARNAWASPSTLTVRIGLIALLLTTLGVVFLQTTFPILFLVPPVLILIAFRCGAGPAGFALMAATVVSLVAVAEGVGPLALMDSGLDQRAMIQQLFLAALIFSVLPVLAILADRNQTEARYRLLAETATDIVARFDPRGRFLYVSPSVRRILGREPEDMLGKDCSGIILDEDLKVIRRTLIDYVAAGPGAEPPRYEYRARRADGTLVWLEATPRAIRDEAGRLVEFNDCVRDITAAKAAERRRAELIETLEMAEATANLGHWHLDLATRAVTWSDQVYAIHGVTRDTFDPSLDDAIGFYHPDDRETVRAWIARAVETGERDAFTLRLRLADDEERAVLSHCVPERDHSGAVVALFGVLQDITEQVRSHEAVAASEARYRLLADRASDIIVTYGVDGRITYISPSVHAATGIAPEDLIGQHVTAMILDEDIPELASRFRAMVKAEPGSTLPGVTYRARVKSGEVRWMEARTTLIRDDAGRVVKFHDVVRDISETKRLEDELIAARDAAEAGAQAKTEFLANMSHELRTPLTAVIGFSGLLKASTALPEAERRYAQRIATASKALLGVINDILDYSKLEADAVDLDPLPFDPAALARETASIVEAQCEAKGLSLVVDIDPALPDAIMGDAGRMRQVMLNFLSNAVKFTAAGEVRLAVGIAGDSVRVAVTDSGIGIPPDRIDALFDRFTQADASTTRVYGGTGLGLAISRRLIEMMDGRIGADSRPGEGSTFWFEVPALAVTDDAAPDAHTAMDLPAGLRVLVADDAAANRELVRAILLPWGVVMDTVDSGQAAVAAVQAEAYDLVLMDVHMPGMDGLEATRTIRAMEGPGRDLPVIALTAGVQPEQVARCRDAGMDACVGKPIQIAELIRAVQTVLGDRAVTHNADERLSA